MFVVTVFVNAIMFYKVKDPISAVANVDDYTSSARLLSATTLRDGQIFFKYQVRDHSRWILDQRYLNIHLENI